MSVRYRPGADARGEQLLVICCERIDNFRYLCDSGNRYPAEFCVLLDSGAVFGKVHAECLIGCNVTVLPLNAFSKLVDGLVRGPRRTAEFDSRHRTDIWNVSFYQEAF